MKRCRFNEPEAAAAPKPNPEYVRTKSDINVAIQKLQALIEAKDIEMQDYQKLG